MSDLRKVIGNAATTQVGLSSANGFFEAMPMAEGGAEMKVSIMMVGGDRQELTLEQLLAMSSKQQLKDEKDCLDVVKRIAAGELTLFDFQNKLPSVTMLFNDGTKLVAYGYGKARWLASFTRADGELGFFCLDPGMTIQKAA